MSTRTEQTRSWRRLPILFGLGLLVAAAAIGGARWYQHVSLDRAQGNEGAAIFRLRTATGILRYDPAGSPLVLNGYLAQIYVKDAKGVWQAEGEPTRDLTAAVDREVRIYAWPDRFGTTGIRTLLAEPGLTEVWSTYPGHPRCKGILYQGPAMVPSPNAASREGTDRLGSWPDQSDLPEGTIESKQSLWDNAVPARDGNIWFPVAG